MDFCLYRMPPPEESRRSLRILVVDDDPRIRNSLSVCLEGAGYEVEEVGSADDALSAITSRPYDLAFLDLRLRNGSGMDLLPTLLED